jgi:hypothetical protein
MNVRAYGKLDEVLDKLAELDNVVSAVVVTGRYDVIAEVVVEGGNAGLFEMTSHILPSIAVVDRSETFVVMAGRNKWVDLARGFEAWGGAIDREHAPPPRGKGDGRGFASNPSRKEPSVKGTKGSES